MNSVWEKYKIARDEQANTKKAHKVAKKKMKTLLKTLLKPTN